MRYTWRLHNTEEYFAEKEGKKLYDLFALLSILLLSVVLKRGRGTEAQGQVPPPLSPPGETGASRRQSVSFSDGTGGGLRSNWPLQ